MTAAVEELARANELLTHRTLVAGAERFTLEEVEVYLRAPGHVDPFVHAHPTQSEPGRFYFHRIGDSYRGGSFKGLDITIGGKDGIGGMLLRTARREDGRRVSGPSLLVDAVLAACGAPDVAALDASIAGAPVDDPRSVLRLVPRAVRALDVIRTARVGLTLKRHTPGDGRDAYLMRRYRLLTEPRAIRKGRVHLVIALHQDGVDIDSIRRVTGTPAAHLRRWLTRYDEGRRLADLGALAARPINSDTLATMHGAWAARFGSESRDPSSGLPMIDPHP